MYFDAPCKMTCTICTQHFYCLVVSLYTQQFGMCCTIVAAEVLVSTLQYTRQQLSHQHWCWSRNLKKTRLWKLLYCSDAGEHQFSHTVMTLLKNRRECMNSWVINKEGEKDSREREEARRVPLYDHLPMWQIIHLYVYVQPAWSVPGDIRWMIGG